nr:murein transglycosylase [Vibrio maerlii]
MLCLGASVASASPLEEQRKIYEQAQSSIDKGELDKALALKKQIPDYSLTPYLDYRLFLRDLNDQSPAQVEGFISQYKEFPFSTRVRAPYLDALYKRKDWQAIGAFQQQEPKGQSYQCIYYRTQFELGNQDLAFEGAEKLWLTGNSIADQCDALLNEWDKADRRSDDKILTRMLLAFEARNSNMVRYLAKLPKTEAAKKQAKSMLTLFNKPDGVAKFAKQSKVTEINREQSKLALQKLARMDVEQAQQSYDAVISGQKFSQDDAQRLADYIAFRLTRTESEELAKWRDEVVKNSSYKPLTETRARLAVQNQDWEGVLFWISNLSETVQGHKRWKYWRGRSEIELGQVEQGKARLKSILGERNFYSAAAAEELQVPITYPKGTIELDKSLIEPYQASLDRIEELIALDKIAAAKSEWRFLLGNVTKDKREMLAKFASQKRWHHLSVTASIQAKMWDKFNVRFPIAHQWWFDFYGEKNDVSSITMLSLARQESALDSEAKSPVGARGLMQIMPATAKATANKYKIKYSGPSELYEVQKNIEIGSQYLGSLLKEYDNNRIFAFAAYNAGPSRVKTWRGRTQGNVDVYSFIESIPFKETRGYVQNILMFETYYRDIMNVEGSFLTKSEESLKY